MADSNTIGKLFVQLLLDDEDFDLEKPEKQIAAFGAQLDDFASDIEEAFSAAAAAVAASTAGILASAVVVGANFQAKMTEVGVIAGATGDEFQQLSDRARELGATTAFSATEAADAMGLLAGAGLDVSETITATGDALNLAGAGGTTLDVAASALASTLSQFQLQASEATRITDVFAKVTAASQFRVEDLAQAMKYGGTVGAGFKWSLEQTVAALAMFRDLGLEGSAAGTALRSSMVGATTASAQNIAVLEKYGLTLEEISPETHTFAEILQAVGKSGITTSDAMVVFGSEAGAAFATLARSAAQGSTKYNELVASLEGSSGTAITMFSDMQENVLGSFAELQSGAEEILLSIFDTMKRPLAQVLDALTETLTEVSDYFKANAGQITERLQVQAEKFISWLSENKQLIAITFYQGAEAVVSLVEVLVQLMPILNELIILVTALFIAKKVLDFGMAIQTLVQGLMAFRTAVIAAEVALTASTGGMYAAVVAVGALVAAIGTLIYQYVSAEAAAKRLKDAQDGLAANNAKVDTERAAALDVYLAKKRDEAQAELESGTASGKLSEARRKELEMLTSLTGATAQQLEAAGRLVVINGELRAVASIVDEGDTEAVSALTDRIDAFQVASSKAKKDAADLEQTLAALKKTGAEGITTVVTTSGTAVQAKNIEELQAKIDDLKKDAGEFSRAADQLKSDYGKASVSAIKTVVDAQGRAAQAVGDSADEAADRAEEAAARAEAAWEKATVAAIQSGADAMERAREGLEDSLADAEGRLRLSHQRELEDLKRAQDKALEEVGDDEIARNLIVYEFAEARTDIEARQAVETRHLKWEEVKKELQDKKKAEEDKTKAEQKAEDDRKSLREKSLNALGALENQGLKESQRIDLERVQFFKENTGLTIDEMNRAAEIFSQKKKDALAQERKDTIAAVKETAKAVLDVLSKVAGIISAVGSGIVSAFSFGYKALSKVADIAKQVAAGIGSIFTTITGGKASLDVLGYISTALDQIASGDSTGSVSEVAVSLIEEMAANVGTFVGGLVDALPEVVDALGAAIPGLVGVLGKALPVLAGELAALIPGVVKVLADAIPDLLRALADALPEVIQALADAIPDIVAVLAESVPIVLQAVVENLPIVVAGLADAIPGLVDILVDAIPVIAQALIDNLPVVVQAIVGAIPELIAAITEVLPELIQLLVDQFPVIISAITESIPYIVDALTEGIPILVSGVVDALPDLLLPLAKGLLDILPVLIQQFPVIIQGLVALIPDLIQAVIDALPAIMTAIIQAIPQIVGSIILALPGIVAALFQLIWEAIVDFVKGFVELIKDALTPGKDKSSSYSGISFVPATMRGVTLHPGERVLTADENSRMFGGAAGASQSNPSVPIVSPANGGMSSSMEALLAVDGRIMDGVLIRANQNGRGKVMTTVKRRAGVKSGIKTSGRFKSWGK